MNLPNTKINLNQFEPSDEELELIEEEIEKLIYKENE